MPMGGKEKRMSMTNKEASNILRLVATEALEGVSRFVESENNRDMFKQAYEMAIKSLEESVAVVRCEDCRYANECSKSVQYTQNEPNTVTIGYSPIEWCSKGKRRSE